MAPAGARIKNQKATIVIEHIIQASDISHTMQQPLACVSQVEQKALWGDICCLLVNGRVEKDPSDFFWYKGDLSLASLTSTSSHWPRSWRNVVSLVLVLESTWVMLWRTGSNGRRTVNRFVRPYRKGEEKVRCKGPRWPRYADARASPRCALNL